MPIKKELKIVNRPSRELTVKKSPSELSEIALKSPTPERPITATDYLNALNVLREKGYKWDEIGKWFESNGVPISIGALRSSYYNHSHKRYAK